MLILASNSPRRRELLSLITKNFIVKTADVEEILPFKMDPSQATEYLSKIKAEPFASPKDTVIGADTVVTIEGRILGKPKDKNEAKEMLELLSGKTHSVFTGVTIFKGLDCFTFSVETKVTFFELDSKEIENYVNTLEPMDKAGAYGIQGKGSLLVKEICGDYFNVVGLPVSKINKILSKTSL